MAMKINYTGEALMGLHMSKRTKDALWQEARNAVKQEVWEAACHEAEVKIMGEIAEDVEANKAIWDFAVEVVTPLVSSRYMGYGMQAMMDGIFLALRERGWGTSRGEELLKDAGKWINQMSGMIFDEYVDAVNNGNKGTDGKPDTDPVHAKRDIDSELQIIYGDYFKPWNDRYAAAGDGSEASFCEYREREAAEVETRKETD